MSADTERLTQLFQAIGLDPDAAELRASQIRLLQERGEPLGDNAERLLEAMADQMGTAETETFEIFGVDGESVSPSVLLSQLSEAVAPDTGLELEDLGTQGSEPTLPQHLERAPSHPGEPPEQMLQTGERVEQYEVLRPLGQGGMGAVFLARDVLLGRKVALKVVHPHLVASAGAVERFLFEARALARFNHPNIVTIYGLGQVRGCPYIALAYLPGDSLRARLRRGRLAQGEAIQIARRVALALAEAHRQSILHCDLKPENVLLARDGQLRVLDFGLAELVQRPLLPPVEGEDGFDRSGEDIPTLEFQRQDHQAVLRGTAPYMAPEQWRREELGPATDVWAFGVTLFEVLCGERPFKGSPVSIYEQVTDLALPAPTPLLLEPHLPRELARLCTRCLDRDPAARPRAGEIAEELTRMLRGGAPAPGAGDESPFRGLMPFRRAHADLFFGREAEIAAFVERLREAALVAVVGPSGAGKSSFVQAGVVPRLESLSPWDSIVMRPGANPLLAVAGRLLQDSVSTESAALPPDPDEDQVESRRTLAARLKEEKALLGRLLRERAQRANGRVVLVVDQFEEVFTLTEDPALREAFCQALLYAGDDAEGPVRVVLTLREDFLGRLAVFPEFVAEVSRGIVVIRTPGVEALQETLTGPLEQRGYRFEDDRMAPEMVEEVAHEPAGLPLLQFAAQRLWDERDREDKVLRRSSLEAIEGVAGALAEHADQVVAHLVGDASKAAREVLISLVTPDGPRATVREEQLIDQVGAGAREAVEHLVEARLVVSRRALMGDRAVSLLELVHESLISRWAQLRRWREESQDDLNLQADLQAAVEQWNRRGRRAEDLWRGLSLAEALDWCERQRGHVPRETELFVERSDREARSQSGRLTRLRFGVVGFVLLFTLAVSAFFWARSKERRARKSRNEAVAARRSARARLGLALLEGAQAATLRGDHAEARAKLRASFEVQDTVGARALFASLIRQPLKFRAVHPEAVFSVATAPDGRLVATGCYDGTIRLWDPATGTVRLLRGHRKEVFSLAFGPHGKRLASGAGDGDVRVWDVGTGRSRVLTGHLDRVYAVAFDATGRRLASAAGDGVIKIWDLRNKEAVSLRGHRGRVSSVAFAPAGDRLFSGGEDRTVRVWGLVHGGRRVLTGHTDEVLVVAGGPSGAVVASAGEDDTIRLWNLDRHDHRVLRAHQRAVTSLAFDPRGGRLASGGEDRSVRVWDLKHHTSRILGTHDARVSDLSFSGTGALLASGSFDRTLKLWDVDTPPPLPPSGHGGWVSGVAFRPDGKQLASASQDQTVRLWNLRTGRSEVLRGHTARVIEVAYGPLGRRLASAAWDKTVRIWDLRTKESRVLRGHTARIFGLDYSPDGKHVASGSWDRTIRVWDVATGKARVLRGHTDRVFSVAFGPQGKRLASGAWDKTVRIWNLATGKARVLRGHTHRVTAVDFAPSGRFVASGSYDTTVRLWDLATGKARVLRGHRDYVWGVAVSPDSRFVASASRDRTIRLWDAATGKLVRTLWGHAMDVNRVAFSPDGTLLASGSDDTTVRLWELPSGRPHWRAPLLLPGPPRRLLTGRGLVPVSGFGRPDPPLGKPRGPAEARIIAAVERGARRAELSEDEHWLALIPHRSRVQLWDMHRGKLRWEAEWRGLKRAIPMAGGVVGLARGRAALITGPDKRRTLVDAGARLIGVSGGRLLVTTHKAVRVFDLQARAVGSFAVDPGVTAAMLTPNRLVLGHRDGTLEVILRRGRSIRRHRPFESTPSQPVTRLAEGPLGTLAAGFRNGIVGLWNPRSGKLLEQHRLHGPVRYLFRVGNHLHVATDLADTRTLDLTIFHVDDCAVMRRIWSLFPATWDHGRAVKRPPPLRHRCRKRRRRR